MGPGQTAQTWVRPSFTLFALNLDEFLNKEKKEHKKYAY